MNKQILLIPGPVTTSDQVKKAMTFDYASREEKMLKVIHEIRDKLLKLGKASIENYSCILFQGTGTYSNEAVIGTISNNAKLLILSNGVYGERLYKISKQLNLNSIIKIFPDDKKISKDQVEKILEENLDITHVAMVHNETTSGVLNPIEKIADVIKKRKLWFMVDAISSFGGIDINIDQLDIDYIVGSSNKCLHSFPGLSFVIAKKSTLLKDKNNSKSLSLNLYDQWKDLESNGQFRFTPPPQLLNALLVAINELIDSGGVLARNKKYIEFNKLLHQKFNKIGIKSYINSDNQGPINSTFYYPKEINYNLLRDYLSSKNIVIYKTSLDNKKFFRIGNIGEISKKEFERCIDIMIDILK